jgi:excisionase family DNA binding protein
MICNLVSLPTIADRWGISTRTLSREIAAGRLAAHRVGGQLRVDAEELTRYLRDRRVCGVQSATVTKGAQP